MRAEGGSLKVGSQRTGNLDDSEATSVRQEPMGPWLVPREMQAKEQGPHPFPGQKGELWHSWLTWPLTMQRAPPAGRVRSRTPRPVYR